MFNHELFKSADVFFYGIYLGVVEDNNDPTKAGRCKIRVLGLHSSTTVDNIDDGITVAELPWAIPAGPIGGGSISGRGWSSVPAQGAHVLVTFIGGDHSYPIYFGSIASRYIAKPDATKGFSDPSGELPSSDYIGEPDWNKAARGTVVDHGTPVGTEPANPSAPVYPDNHVLDTGQIIVEHDSTPGKERWCITHKPSKSYMEIQPDGTVVLKSVAKRYDVTVGDNFIHVGGAESKNVVGNSNETVGGTKQENITGDLTISVNNETHTVGGTLTINATGKVTVNAPAVDLGVGTPLGVVQGNCNCIITGAPHPFVSATVKATP